MQADYRRDISHSYLILSGEEAPDIASYQVRMLVTNQISGFLPCQIQQIDQKMMFYYDVTSKQTLQMLLEHRQIRKELLELLLSQIAEALEKIRSYLLGLNGLVLRPEYIFLDAAGRQLWFCYYPGNEQTFQEQIRELSEYLLPRLEHQDRMAVMLGYVFYQKCVEETVTAEVFQELLHGGFREWQEEKEEEREVQREVFHKPLDKTEGEKEWKKDNDGVPRSREELLEAFFAPEEQEEKRLVWDMKRRLLFFGTAAVAAGLLAVLGLGGYLLEGCLLVGASGGIVLVGVVVKRTLRDNREQEEEMEKYLCTGWEKTGQEKRSGCPPQELQSSGEQENRLAEKQVQRRELRESVQTENQSEETICLEPEFAGESKEKARLIPEGDMTGGIIRLEKEICLVGKEPEAADVVLPFPAVSRIHARFLWNGETYLLSDLNSRNGTGVNGELLETGKPRALVSGDQIQFANLTYRFQK